MLRDTLALMPAGSFHALVLGLVQGLTEFLPISSSAHLILIPRYFGWEDPGLAFDVALHLGTLAGVLLYFWKDLVRLATHLDEPVERNTVLFLIVATIPGALAGLLLEHKAETVFRSPILIAWSLLIMGTLLGLADRFSKRDKSISHLTIVMAGLIGLAQSLALIPGVSRSGITITTGLALGLRRDEAARFSFLMSIPIIAGAGLLKLKAIVHSPDKMALSVGFLASAMAGVFAIWLLFKVIRASRYTPFVVYRFALAAFIFLNVSKF